MIISPSGTIPCVMKPGDDLNSVAKMYHTTAGAIKSVNPYIDLNILDAPQVVYIPVDYYYKTAGRKSMQNTGREEQVKNLIRMLWEQHVFWTRLVIISMVFGLPDTKLVTDRLLRNPDDFAAALKPFYGEETAAKFADLLKNHLTIAAELVSSAKAGNTAAAEDAERRWYSNADEIADFLAAINPFWSAEEWRSMLHEHLKMTKDEAVDFLTQEFENSITQFDDIEKEALEMADVMSNGVIRQFSI
ncbi:MAG TPA: LysM peptidoglycan-binding domain-containing protein [Ruminiclostridium sp.]|nr:LysM peptidoglycan-binding domain-containing protein [Ruminiclostridium sp.]